MKNNRMRTVAIAIAVITVLAFGAYNIQARSEYSYNLSQFEHTSAAPAPAFAAEGNKALFGSDLIEEKQDMQLDIAVKLKENLIGNNVDVSGDGCLIIDDNEYPFTISEGELEQIETKSKKLYYHGWADGYIEIDGDKKEVSMGVDIMPEDDDRIITMIIDAPGGAAALAFGEQFSEHKEYLAELSKESQKADEEREKVNDQEGEVVNDEEAE